MSNNGDKLSKKMMKIYLGNLATEIFYNIAFYCKEF